ncbi:hypothetical protein MJK72_05810 [Klebsiella pneumoniae]|nr:hypothetical protein MJK72_05810 [Klebsiella pneumoniae]
MLDFEEGRFLRAVKNVSVNEPFFQGHFRGKPILPGVLSSWKQWRKPPGFWRSKASEELEPGELYYFAGIDEAHFKRPGSTRRSDDYGSPFRENPPRPDPFQRRCAGLTVKKWFAKRR